MKNIPFFCLFLAFSMTLYSQQLSVDIKSIGIIDLEKAFANRKTISVNDISISSEYIRLETNAECLTGTQLAVYSNDKYLVTIDREKVLLFDRKDGKFIREVGRKGNGPGEYSRTYKIMPFNEEMNLIYAGRNKSRYGYSLEGQIKEVIIIPELVSEIGDIGNNQFAAFLPDYQGGEKKKIIIFNHKDSVLKTFPNYLYAPKTASFFAWNPNSWFYKLNKQLYFYQLFNDTIFHVETNSITPRYVLNMGQFSPPYKMKTSTELKPEKYFFIQTIQESSRYLFCSFNYNKKNFTAVFDKNKLSTIINDYSPESGRGFINNINDFVPLEFSSINENDELVCTIDAHKIKQWFAENSEKIEKLPENVKNLKDINETDNPVIIIAKLKR